MLTATFALFDCSNVPFALHPQGVIAACLPIVFFYFINQQVHFFCHLSGRMLHENVLDYVLVGVLSHPFCPLQVLFLMPKPGWGVCV